MVIFSFAGVKALDVVAANEAFSRAAYLTDAGYEVTIASESGGPVQTESGLTLSTKAVPKTNVIDTLVLPGGSGAHSVRSDVTIMSWIAAASRRARRTVAIGSGALLAAEATRGSTHCSGREISTVVVGSGAASFPGGIDTVLKVIQEDCGADVANEVARWLEVHERGAGGPSQLADPAWTPRAKHHGILVAQSAIEADPGAKHAVSELARRAAMSPRHFARIFLDELGETPSAYVERARLQLARRKLEETTDTVAKIAACCGFGTAETMRRTFTRRIGVSPTEYRRSPDRHRVPAVSALVARPSTC